MDKVTNTGLDCVLFAFLINKTKAPKHSLPGTFSLSRQYNRLKMSVQKMQATYY